MNGLRYILVLVVLVIGTCLVLNSTNSITVIGDSEDSRHLENEAYRMLLEDVSHDEIDLFLYSHGYLATWDIEEHGIVLVIGDGDGAQISSTDSDYLIWSRIFT